MPVERTFSIIKPDATARNLTGAINAMIEKAGLRIVAQKRLRITREQAETFYEVHRQRPFFRDLVEFMISGPVVVQVLEGNNAIAKYRDAMGATDPAKAAPRAPSARCMPAPSARTRCMAQMPRKQQQRRLLSFLRAMRLSVDRGLVRPNDRPFSLARHDRERLERDGSDRVLGRPAQDHVDQCPAFRGQCRRHCDGMPRAPASTEIVGDILGAGVAVILRIIFTVIIAQLMLLPYLKIIGGLALFYIAAKLLVPAEENESEVEAVEHLWRAVRIVAVADIVMSLDNVIAIAAAAQNNFALILIGLAVSIPMIVAGAALIMALLERYPILVWAGAALLGWIVGETIVTDPVIQSALEPKLGAEGFHYIMLFAALLGAILVLVVGGIWRRSNRQTAPGKAGCLRIVPRRNRSS